MLRRPVLVSGLMALTGSTAGWAQPSPGRVWRIGVLSEAFPDPGSQRFLAFLGFVDGRNFVVDFKFAQGQRNRLPALASELIAGKPDVLIGLLNAEIMALKKATSSIPIVMMYASSPVEMGMIESLARPGGNVTGTSTFVPEFAGKMVQLFHETLPEARNWDWLADMSYPGANAYSKWFDAAIAKFGLKARIRDVQNQSDLDLALGDMERNKPQALGISDSGVPGLRTAQILELAGRLRIPTMFSIRPPVVQGGLMSYSADFFAMGRRNGMQIERILKGTKPADIPVEEPAKFLLTINMKTARALGLTIPQKVLLSADELIE